MTYNFFFFIMLNHSAHRPSITCRLPTRVKIIVLKTYQCFNYYSNCNQNIEKNYISELFICSIYFCLAICRKISVVSVPTIEL